MSVETQKSTRRGAYKTKSYDEKYIGLKHYFEKNLSAEEVAEAIDSTAQTVRNWLRKIKHDFANIELLRPQHTKRKDRENIHLELEEWVQVEILSLIDRNPTMGPLKIKQYFERHHQIIISTSRVYYFLKEKGIIDKRSRMRIEKEQHVRRFEYDKPLAAVQMDLMGLTLSGGTKVYMINILDDYSRFILASKIVPVKTMDEVIRVFSAAVKKYGIPDRVITDKGSEFVSWQSFTRFEELLCTLDVELIASGPEKPQCQGKVERYHQTLRNDFENVRGPFDLSCQVQLELDDFVAYYNNERPHQGIKGVVPADRFYGLETVLTEELEQYRSGAKLSEQIYFSCNIQGEKIVVSGPRSNDLQVYRNKNTGPNNKSK